MRITIIGATGMVGSRIVAEASARRHDVIAASRNPKPAASAAQRIDSSNLVRFEPGVCSTGACSTSDYSTGAEYQMRVDAADRAAVDRALNGAEAVVLSVRAQADKGEEFARLSSTVLDCSAHAGVPLLIVGGAGPLLAPDEPGVAVIDVPRYVPLQWRSIAAASIAQLDVCQNHANQNWTYLSPPAVLEPGTRTGVYQRGTTTLLTADDGSSRISVEDLAVAVIDELESPGHEQRITVAH